MQAIYFLNEQKNAGFLTGAQEIWRAKPQSLSLKWFFSKNTDTRIHTVSS